MTSPEVTIVPLRSGLSFGARVHGVTRQALQDDGNRRLIAKAFEDHALLLFEDVESSPQMQLAISEVIGPLKDHPLSQMERADEDLAPGVIKLESNPDEEQLLAEIDGKLVSNYVAWHFDQAYTNELNRAGVLRAVVIAPDGGMTGFADGIALYAKLPPRLRDALEGVNVIYDLGIMLPRLRFGVPDGMRIVQTTKAIQAFEEQAKTSRRAIHPAVWRRPSGEKVLHVGFQHAVGIEGRENAEGDRLLKEVSDFVLANTEAYYHQWKLGQMLTWDNWRMLHCVTGTNPACHRVMHRTTIAGDYGLGYFEGDPRPKAAAEALA